MIDGFAQRYHVTLDAILESDAYELLQTTALLSASLPDEET